MSVIDHTGGVKDACVDGSSVLNQLHSSPPDTRSISPGGALVHAGRVLRAEPQRQLWGPRRGGQGCILFALFSAYHMDDTHVRVGSG